MRAFVTGGTGFVGSNLVAALADRGIAVRVLRRSTSPMAALAGVDCETVEGDVLDPVERLAEAMADCDWVFHTAAISDYWRYRTRTRLYATNVDGTRNVATAALRAGVERFVYTSSLGSLGVPQRGRLLTEADQFNLRPRQFPYGHSKFQAEDEIRAAVEAGLPAVMVNPSVVIGPRDVNRIAASMVAEAASGRLRVAAPGGVNFVAVDDVVAGHIAAAERGRVGERYILGGENLTFKEAFTTVCEITGTRGPSMVLPRWTIPVAAAGISVARAVVGPRLPIGAQQMRLSAAEIYADPGKSHTELGVPFTPFRTALQAGYEWYRDNGYLPK
ncbi:NAD-dependent epimerase/dehydratase family protein [Mycobacterium sp. M1]|uniref:NAD-dependent epimerase/dehydratase family protein n=1 Tax=Mycolicibacter acidiphilus TaxID=2835306 RepID=A0ABS5RIX7_9MYCO|nr:NAD-dependent epimerase/dehydratase family protein [Mycolicibacter acidiphilus]MBS9532894.1 NAD-dependent epimerase/dehydratase family protein [Mycolicibacter acidiphilus]